MGVKIGVLALQGDVSEHIGAFRRALDRRDERSAGRVVPVWDPGDLSTCDAVALPGGESTTISRLIERNGLHRPLQEFGGSIFATCAGMVLLATTVADARIHPLGLLDMTVERNAFGRQRESFEADIGIEGFTQPYHAIFIRAPVATRVGEGIRVLARLKEGAVAVECDRYMAVSFHPELGTDLRLHERFLESLRS